MKLRTKIAWTSTTQCTLGENPLWHATESTLYWIDVVEPAVFRWDASTDSTQRFALPKPPASIFLREPGSLLVAMRGGFAWMDTSNGELHALELAIPLIADERFNDGRCDRFGEIWISTMDRRLESGIGSLVHLDSSRQASVTSTQAILGNGVCFSPDGQSLYFSDTFERAIYRYELKTSEGSSRRQLGRREIFARLDSDAGRPDGCTVDSEGCLWSARVGGGRIDRYAPDGRLIDVLELPVTHPTHCTFGGADLRTLFVTSSRHPRHEAIFAQQASAGAVLAFEVNAQGSPEPLCMIR